LLSPVIYLIQLVIELSKEGSAFSQCKLQPATAEVVGPAFREDGGKSPRQSFGEKWEVLIYQLFLEGNGKSADEDLALAAARDFYCGQKVCEAFANAGAGFNYQTTACLEGILNGMCHFELLGPGFKTGKGFGD
jgi:hypothetical protein